jgi:uncharacterized protein YqeY
MSLKENLKKALVEAAKAKDQVRLDAVRSILSAIQYKEKERTNVELTEAEILAVIGTLCKQRRESIDQFQKGGRADLVAKESRELEILQKFLPEQLGRDEVEKTVQRLIAGLGAKGPNDFGRVMKEAVKELAGKADNRLVNEVVRSLLK